MACAALSAVETLTCLHCERDWQRARIGGWKPKLCPDCAMTHKLCSKCRRALPLAGFNKGRDERNPSGKQAWCRECFSSAKQTYTCGACDVTFQRIDRGGPSKNRTRRVYLCDECELTQKWCAACDQVLNHDDFYSSKGKPNGLSAHCRECRRTQYASRTVEQRRSRVVKKYGITLAEWDVMYVAQRGCCAICANPPMPDGKGLVVDHDHETNEVRSLLCGPCNSGLGLFADDPDRLRAAALYIERHGEA